MPETDWNPHTYYCTACDDDLRSELPGEFAGCSCGESYVDQTRHYTRVGGLATPRPASKEESGG